MSVCQIPLIISKCLDFFLTLQAYGVARRGALYILYGITRMRATRTCCETTCTSKGIISVASRDTD